MLDRIGYYQFNPQFGQVQINLSRVVKALESIEADIVVLPELPFTGYNFRDRDELSQLAEEIGNSPTIDSLGALCQKRKLHIVTGFAEKHREKIYNSAVLIGPGAVISVYRKLHLFNTEKNVFDPGDTPLNVVKVNQIPVGLMICFDWAFPEVTRTLALKGAHLICHPSNLVLNHCQQAMLTRSLENGVFIVTANRFGTETRSHGEIIFTGQSQITGPGGQLLCRAPTDGEALNILDIQTDRAAEKSLTLKNNLFKDRRPEFYQDLLS
jgi:predicted amidohydrolase